MNMSYELHLYNTLRTWLCLVTKMQARTTI